MVKHRLTVSASCVRETEIVEQREITHRKSEITKCLFSAMRTWDGKMRNTLSLRLVTTAQDIYFKCVFCYVRSLSLFSVGPSVCLSVPYLCFLVFGLIHEWCVS